MTRNTEVEVIFESPTSTFGEVEQSVGDGRGREGRIERKARRADKRDLENLPPQVWS
jgi:hypothetical protein